MGIQWISSPNVPLNPATAKTQSIIGLWRGAHLTPGSGDPLRAELSVAFLNWAGLLCFITPPFFRTCDHPLLLSSATDLWTLWEQMEHWEALGFIHPRCKESGVHSRSALSKAHRHNHGYVIYHGVTNVGKELKWSQYFKCYCTLSTTSVSSDSTEVLPVPMRNCTSSDRAGCCRTHGWGVSEKWPGSEKASVASDPECHNTGSLAPSTLHHSSSSTVNIGHILCVIYLHNIASVMISSSQWCLRVKQVKHKPEISISVCGINQSTGRWWSLINTSTRGERQNQNSHYILEYNGTLLAMN